MSLSLYIHIPFCQRKCPYCDFNTYAGLNRLFEPLAAAVVREIEAAGAARGRPAVKTIFIGGGTPTVLPAELLAAILAACRRAFDVQPGAEITSEANPGTVDVGRFAALREMGVNRLSMGVQSFDPAELDFLGRIHSAPDAVAAFDAARAAGFDNVNLDFIYGLPDQSPATWRRTLEQALDLAPEHLSLYSLTIEEGTPFGEWAAAGRLAQPDPDLAADLYELASDMLASVGYVQYEISNWAKPGDVNSEHPVPKCSAVEWTVDSRKEQSIQAAHSPIYQSTVLPATNPAFACQHNLTYWRNEEYLGFGPGAHSSEKGRRWANVQPVAEYIAAITAGLADAEGTGSSQDHDAPWVDFEETSAVAGLRPSPSALADLPSSAVAGLRPSHALPWIDFVEQIDDRLAIGETMMLGLRLVREGVAFERFEQRHGQQLLAIFGADVLQLERLGLLQVLPDRVRLTPAARLLGNQVFARFLP